MVEGDKISLLLFCAPPIYFKIMFEDDTQERSDDIAKQRLKRLKPGSVLLSKEALKDPNFDTTAVLLCLYNKDGAYGLVLNRPSHMPLSEMFDGYSSLSKKKKIYIGGPVRQEELQVLQITDTPVSEAHEIFPQVYLGGHWSNIEDILEQENNSLRLFLGYSGWAPGQLELEIIAGAWEVFNLDLKALLEGDEGHLLTNVENIEEYLQEMAKNNPAQ